MWIPVDPIRGIIGKRQVFDPTPSSTSGQSKLPRRRDNIMLYVIALEEDGYGRDVTARYARDYTAKVAKVQGARASSGGRGRREWWERVIQVITRPYRLVRPLASRPFPSDVGVSSPRACQPRWRGSKTIPCKE